MDCDLSEQSDEMSEALNQEEASLLPGFSSDDDPDDDPEDVPDDIDAASDASGNRTLPIPVPVPIQSEHNLINMINQNLINNEDLSENANGRPESVLSNILESQNYPNLRQYIVQRLQREMELRLIEDEQFNNALLESRDEFDSLDTVEKNDSSVLDYESQKYSKIKIKHKRAEICCICMDHFSCNQQVYWLPCKHLFHNQCLNEWVKYKNDCPTCRNELPLK